VFFSPGVRFELEKQKVCHAKQEAVYRRKLEELTAIQQRNQETIRKLTQNQRAAVETVGFRQLTRFKELRQFVQRELDGSMALQKLRASLKIQLDRRSEVSHRLAELQGVEEADDADKVALELEVEEISGTIERLQREVMEMKSRVGMEEDGGGEDTKRWFTVKTLGEARHVLAILFDKALKSQANRRRSSSLGNPITPAPRKSAAIPRRVLTSGPTQTVPQKETEPSSAKPVKEVAKPKTVYLEEEEDDIPSSSSSSEEDCSDSDYDPNDSPSRRGKGKGRRGQRGSKEGCVVRINKVKVMTSRKKRRSGSGASQAMSDLQKEEDEINALLSDNDHPPPRQSPRSSIDTSLPIASLEPLSQWTVPELKDLLRAHKLPVGGKKGKFGKYQWLFMS